MVTGPARWHLSIPPPSMQGLPPKIWLGFSLTPNGLAWNFMHDFIKFMFLSPFLTMKTRTDSEINFHQFFIITNQS